MQNRVRKSPPPTAVPTESPRLLRELIRFRAALLQLQAAYTYGSILLRQDLPTVADLLDTAAHGAGKDALALGILLQEQGASHAVNVTLNDTPYRLLTDADSHAPVVALRLLKDRIRDEKSGISHLSQLPKAAHTESVQHTILTLMKNARERIATLESKEGRLARS